MVSLPVALVLFANPDAYTQRALDLVKVPATVPFATSLSDLQVSGVPANAEMIRADGTLTVQVRQRNVQAYSVEVKTGTNKVPIKKGDVIFAMVTVSCPQSRHESGEGLLTSWLQVSGPPWNSQSFINGSVGRPDKTLYFSAKSSQDLDVGKGEFTFHVGGQAQTLVFKGLAILNLGPDASIDRLPKNRLSWPGMEPNAPWRRRAATMIDQHRKANLTVTVRDAQGRPVRNAPVRVKMTRHQYEFGSFIEEALHDTGPDGEKYRKFFLDNFNKITVPMYWADWGWPNNRALYMKNADWARANKLPIKAHVLLYPGFTNFMPAAAGALRNDPPALRKMIEDHIDEIFAATKPYDFVSWDIINETRDLRELPAILGDEFFADVYKRAHRLNPKPVFYINDYAILENGGQTEENQDFYIAMIQKLLRQGAPVEGIGLQGHFGETVTSSETIWRILDRFAAFKLPIQTTEFDIVTRDEEGQAAYLRDYYTAFFAHPSTTGITQWGFWEKSMWQPLGGMVRTDWSLKPNAKAYRKLIFGDWWTDVTRRTDANGRIVVRGFKGDYEISAGGKTVKAKLDKPVTVGLRR